MQIGKSVLKSSHDLVLIVGAAIAIAMMVSSMLHSSSIYPANLGMGNAMRLARTATSHLVQ